MMEKLQNGGLRVDRGAKKLFSHPDSSSTRKRKWFFRKNYRDQNVGDILERRASVHELESAAATLRNDYRKDCQARDSQRAAEEAVRRIQSTPI